MVNNAVRIIMFSSINIDGKQQAIDKGNGIIIQNLIALLESPNTDIVENVRHALVVIADLPKGYSIVVRYLSAHLEHLKSIFGPTSILPLYGLLFKANIPPFLTKENLDKYKKAAFCIAHFINNEKHEKEALQYSIEKNCQITRRLLPILLDHEDRINQERVARAIIKICEKDRINRLALRKTLDEVGDVQNELFSTTIREQVTRYQPLLDLLKQAREEATFSEEMSFKQKNNNNN